MKAQRVAVFLLLVAVLAAGCAGDDDSGSISVDDPIGAPEEHSVETDTSSDFGPLVAKSASVELEVPRSDLGTAAQQVVDIATSPRSGGFLVSSVVDTRDGYGMGSVLVKVPDERFEEVVGQLDRVGDVVRQALEGHDLAPGPAATQRERREVAAGVDFSSIDVSITAASPPPVRQTTFERALDTAETLSVGIASGLLLAASVALPLGFALVVLYLVGARIRRRLRPGWEA